jgi:hypothetical protein
MQACCAHAEGTDSPSHGVDGTVRCTAHHLPARLPPPLLAIRVCGCGREGGSGAVAVAAALSAVMSGAARPLRARLGTVLGECGDAVVAYRLLGFLAFYSDTVRRRPCSSFHRSSTCTTQYIHALHFRSIFG